MFIEMLYYGEQSFKMKNWQDIAIVDVGKLVLKSSVILRDNVICCLYTAVFYGLVMGLLIGFITKLTVFCR